MNTRIVLIVIASALAGCGSATKKPPEPKPAPVAVAPQPEEPAPIPVDSVKYRILQVANEEWQEFGGQKVVFGEDGEESIPHVGIWEDDDWAHSERVRDYWRAVGMRRLSGRDCKEPWSAAFISWVMQMAGVPRSQFPAGSSHSDYLNRILRESQFEYAQFIPHPIREYKPKPGDLICATRGSTYIDETAETPSYLGHAKLHCDIVMETKGRSLEAIGGNVRNSVSRSYLTLSQEGFLQPTRRRPWFLVIENRMD